jgi:enoyl-[acyl-carrier protein] reductase / trans-2-enoyl-CoA reductase (NAD+)
MYALTTELLKERGEYKDLPELAAESMEIFRSSWDGRELRLDRAYQACLPEFFARSRALEPEDLPQALRLLLSPSPN